MSKKGVQVFVSLAFRKLFVIIFGFILNPHWCSKEKRAKHRQSILEKSSILYLMSYARYVRSISVIKPPEKECKERAFSIWFQGEKEAPPLIRACFASMRKHLQMELIVLDDKTIFDWISLPDFIMKKWKKGEIGAAHFSDICRIELLYRYGGVWMDATDYITADIPKEIMECDFFMYMTGNVGYSYSFIQNCFIRATQGNPLLGIWRDAIHNYWRHMYKSIDYFVHHLMFRLIVHENQEAKLLFDKMPKLNQDDTHTLWYKYKDTAFDEEIFSDLKQKSFLHKTSFKDTSATNPVENSFAAHIIETQY